MAISQANQKKLDGLIRDTIIPALFEDFEWENQKELDEAVDYLSGQMVQNTDEVLSPS